VAAKATKPDMEIAASTPATGRIAARAIEGFASLAIIECESNDRARRLTAKAKGSFMTGFKFNGVVARFPLRQCKALSSTKKASCFESRRTMITNGKG
jgi:hypothetical protein